MLYSPNSSKPAKEVLLSRKKKIQIHPTISLNNVQFKIAPYQKHLNILPDEKLIKQHIDSAILNIYKSISVIK